MSLHLGLAAASGTTTTTTPDPSKVLRDSLHPLSQMLVGLWPLWTLLGVIAVGKVAWYAWKVWRLNRAGMFEIDRMDGHEFERKLALMFRSLGYRAEIVGGSGGDYGGDLVLSRDGTRTVVQAKRKTRNVGVKAVQEAVAAKAIYRADAAMVVTNARFTKQAQHLASENKVKLWGRDELVTALLKGRKSDPARVGGEGSSTESAPAFAPVSAPSPVLTEATAVAESAPAAVASPSGAFCARCGQPVSVKVRDYCLANPERFSGLVYCFEDQRDFKRP